MSSKQTAISRLWRVIALTAVSLFAAAGVIYALAVFSVYATVETEPTNRNADDPAIWIHPTNPALSVILGTFKDHGVSVYDLDGNLVQSFEDDGGMNNVDLRYNFPLGNTKVAVAVATDRNSGRNTLAVYKIDPATRTLQSITADSPMDSQTSEVYGVCMYVSPVSGNYYAFIAGKDGVVEQWELFDNNAGKVAGTLVRSFDVGTKTEGCVADDVYAQFYVGEEDVGIWKYGAEPGDGNARTAVDDTSTGHLTMDVEGLTIYYTADNDGYLIASSQGSNEFVIYDRLGSNDYITTFDIVDGNGIDHANATDGIDVTNAALGSAFPEGLFVVHDNDDVQSSNFKLVPWQDIAAGTEPDLISDTVWNPRWVGLPPTADFAAAPISGTAPLTVTFSDQSTGVRSGWSWDFGDGGTSTETNPVHTYTAAGLYTVTLTVTNSFGSDTLTKASYISIGSQEVVTQEIPLSSGWNLVSSFVDPADPALETLLAGIESELQLMKNEDGQLYWPDQGINDIINWDVKRGYQILISSPVTLSITGTQAIASLTPIELQPGWHMTAYLRDTPLPVDQALSSISGQISLAKNGAGKIYWPSYGVNQIGDMQPGAGYELSMVVTGTLTYPNN